MNHVARKLQKEYDESGERCYITPQTDKGYRYGYHMRAQKQRLSAAFSGANARSVAPLLGSLQQRGAARGEALPHVGGQRRGDILVVVV